MKANRFRTFITRATMAISLFLMALSSALWIRGASYADFVQLAVPSRTAIYLNGGLYLYIFLIHQKAPGLPPVENLEFRTGTSPTVPERAKVWPPLDWYTGSTHLDPSLATQYNITIQWWALVLSFGLFPLGRMSFFCVRFLKRRYRRTRGLCAHCGYDLRASQERCPECGQAINAEAHESSPDTSSHGF